MKNPALQIAGFFYVRIRAAENCRQSAERTAQPAGKEESFLFGLRYSKVPAEETAAGFERRRKRSAMQERF